MSEGPDPAGRPRMRIWDLPTRLIHWLFVALIPFSWWSATNDHLQWHRLSGYTLLGLLIFRLIWGLVGSETARFTEFLKGPRAILAYVRGQGPTPIGHNPMGGWSVAAMLLVLCGQVGMGLFAVDEDGLDPSPLAKFVSFETGRTIAKLHHLNFYLLLGLIVLHMTAVAVYAARGQSLVGSMVTGRRTFASETAAPRLALAWLALPVAAIASLLAWILAHGLSI